MNSNAPYVLRREQFVPRPLDEVFEFFSRAANLEQLTPAWLKFRILTPEPIEMRPGTLIQYKIGWHGIPMNWTTEILKWDPPHGFVDVEKQGPYKLWHHTHTFQTLGSGTLITDVVEYAMPFGWLGRIAHALQTRREVEQIFEYRKARVDELFG